ncbi:hypothetical protein V2J09_000962 [Rumex salicifolius]
MKRLRSYGEDLGSASGEKEIDRPLSSAGAGSLSSSSSTHHRRWRFPDNGRGRPGLPDDDRDREMPRGGVRKRIDHDFDGFDDREGPRGFRKRPDHDFGNGSEDREAWRNVRKRIDHDLDGFDDREGGRGLRKRIDHDLPDNFDDREGPRGTRKRLEHDPDNFDRRKGFDRFRERDGIHRGGHVSPLMSPKGGYVAGERERDRFRDRERDRIHRSESFCVSRGDFPKGFRSDRDWSKREGNVPSWKRFGHRSKREVDEDSKSFAGDKASVSSRSGVGIVDGGTSSRESFRSPHRSKDVKSPTWSKDSKDSVEPVKDVKKSESTMAESGRSGNACEIEEGELHPDSIKESHSSSVSVKEVKNVAESEIQTQIEPQVEGDPGKKQNEFESVLDVESSMHDSEGDVRLINKEKVENANNHDANKEEQAIQLEATEAEIAPARGKLPSTEGTCADIATKSEEIKSQDTAKNGDRFILPESLRADQPECSALANDEFDCQAKDVNNTTLTGQRGEGEVADALDLQVCDNNGHRPAISESVRDDHSESTVRASDELESQAKVVASDTILKSPMREENMESAIDLEVSAEVAVMPQVPRDVAIMPTKDVDIMPQISKDIDIMPQVNEDADARPQVTKEIDIMSQVTKDIDIMPQVTKDMDSMPQVTQHGVEDHHHERQLSLHIGKDKGKGVAVCPSDVEFSGKGSLIEQSFIPSNDVSSEGPSIRGFELFSCTAGVKADKGDKSSFNKAENEKMNLEPLELSLALPNVSVPAPSHSIAPPPNSPPRARSIQSRATTLLTGSDAFTTSVSFSGSLFNHNPSCSLTHNSIDYDCEQSVKSRPLFQGVDWQALSVNDSMPKELLKYQKVSSNFDGSLRMSNSSQSIYSSQPVCAHASVMDRSVSLRRQVSGMKMRNQDDVGSTTPAQSAGSQGTMFDRVKENGQALAEGSGSRLFRSISHGHLKQVASARHESDFINGILGLVVSEPVQTVAWKFAKMADESVRCLKEGIQEILLKEDHKQHLNSLQGLLNNRSDLTLETLLKCHRDQLEILVAIKTGVPYFLRRGDSISSVDLAEIFLNLKCRNPNCGSALPVDECDCKFCSKKSGFCSMCMCLVCSKFDTASNTCGWVGCDFCSHWCHTDCGLQNYYIKIGQSVSSTQGTSEMQFYCMACDHPSEMFGFVMDVFKTCASEWKADAMIKELECVKRIFSSSNDTRGKMLHGIANQLVMRLKAGSNLQEVYNQIMGFFKNCDSKLGNVSASSGRELQTLVKNNETNRTSEMATSTGSPIWFKTAPSTDPTHADNAGPTIPSTEGSSAGNSRRSIWDSVEMQRMMSSDGKRKPMPTASPTPVVDELESLVKIKQAESKMFQSRADEARREADRLKHIAIAKSEKINEAYSAEVAKLQLEQVEEMRRKKVEELQVLERSHQEYVNMKTRMQEDIKELLLRMEDAKKNGVHHG